MSNYAYGFVYVWYDRKRKKYCVGSHHGPENDNYTSSTGHMDAAIKKRPEDFKRRIVARNYHIDDFEETQRLEQRWLDMIKPEERGVKYYNISPWATGGRPKGHSNTKNRRSYLFIDPEGITHEVWGLAEFCKTRGLYHNLMSKVALGHRKSHKGWTIHPEHISVNHEKHVANRSKAHKGKKSSLRKSYKLVDPLGQIHEFVGLNEFSTSHGLKSSALSHVLKGKRKSHLGWTALISVSASIP